MRSVCGAIVFVAGAYVYACANAEQVPTGSTNGFYTPADSGTEADGAAVPTPTSSVPPITTTTPPPGTGGVPGTGGMTSTGGAMPETGGGGGAPCSAGLKKCSGICVQPTPALGCSLSDCTPCAQDENGTTTCNGEICVLTCNDGYSLENGVCTAPVSCTNNILDGTETDKDCGGADCPPCAPGKACTGDSDCAKGPCENNVCGCTPLTCDTACGTGVDDGCGGTIDCSNTCMGGDVCFHSLCCTPITSCSPGLCDMTDDGCGGKVDCGSCADGVCLNGQCCTPLTPQQCTADQCGTTNDGCGGTIDCGTSCGAGKVCYNNACCTPRACTISGGCGYQDDGCGGVACPLCGSGGDCDASNDCQSGKCTSFIFTQCTAPQLQCCE